MLMHKKICDQDNEFLFNSILSQSVHDKKLLKFVIAFATVYTTKSQHICTSKAHQFL